MVWMDLKQVPFHGWWHHVTNGGGERRPRHSLQLTGFYEFISWPTVWCRGTFLRTMSHLWHRSGGTDRPGDEGRPCPGSGRPPSGTATPRSGPRSTPPRACSWWWRGSRHLRKNGRSEWISMRKIPGKYPPPLANNVLPTLPYPWRGVLW